MSASDVVVVEPQDGLIATLPVHLVAVRWDLVPWGLVLDVDAAESEAAASGWCRMWLVFTRVDTASCSLVGIAVPNGIWLSGLYSTSTIAGGVAYELTAMVSNLGERPEDVRPRTEKISLVASGMTCLRSTRSYARDRALPISWPERSRVGSDESFVAAIRAIAPGWFAGDLP